MVRYILFAHRDLRREHFAEFNESKVAARNNRYFTK